MNDYICEGNLCAEPRTNTVGGQFVLNFRIAVNNRVKRNDVWEDGDPCYFDVSLWGGKAERIAGHVEKGTRVIVKGSLKPRTYEKKDGTHVEGIEIKAFDVKPLMRISGSAVAATDGGGFGGGNGGGGFNA